LTLIVSLRGTELLNNGPIIKVAIGKPSDYANPTTVRALIDTGAAFTIVNPALAGSCQLLQRGKTLVHAVGHRDYYLEYAASIQFPDSDLRSLRVHPVVACPIFHREMSCLIGRGILQYWELRYNGLPGQFSIQDLRP